MVKTDPKFERGRGGEPRKRKEEPLSEQQRGWVRSRHYLANGSPHSKSSNICGFKKKGG